MPCEPNFPKTIDLGCISEIVTDIRSGVVKPVVIAEKVLWALGCGTQYLKPQTDDKPVIMRHLSDDALVDELEASLKIARGTEASVASINPIIVSLLVQIALRFLSKIQF